MDRTIRVRSSRLDRAAAELEALGREKESKLKAEGIINGPLFRGICIAPALEEGKLGYFSPSDLSIVISEDAVISCSGDTVRNIFLHELAHAVDWSISGAISGHSVLFRQYCRMLGTDPGFEKSRVRTGISADRSRKEKIRKLLALSSSPFENEAAEAIRKAQKLMLEGSTEAEERVIYTSELYEAKRLPFWTRELAWYASSSSGVYSIIVPRDDSRVITIHGSVEEIELAIYIFDYIISASDQEIRRMRREGRAVSRGSFICGAVDTLSEKTRGQTEEGALIAIGRENEELAKALIYSKSKVRTSYSRTSINRNSYDLGHDFGNRIDISRSRRIKLIGTE